jgi:DNA-binding beta-propeller fold protein YncE
MERTATPPPEPEPTPSPPAAQATPAPSPEPFNVWAGATGGPLPPQVQDLPPRVYIPHETGGDVAILDPLTMQIVDRFSVGRTPHHVAPAHDMTQLYVNVMDSSHLAVLDIQTGKPVGSIPVPVPYNLYFSPDGTKAIVAAERLNRLDFFDPVTWAPLARVQIPGSGVDHLDFSADASYLLVGCEFGGQVVKVDVHNMAVTGMVNPRGLPVDVKCSATGDVFYVANQGRHGVVVIDPVTMQEIGFLPTGRGCHGFCVSRDAKSLFVANRLAGSISVLDFASGSIVTTWNTGGSPDMLQVSPDGTQLWASDRYHGTVSVYHTGTGSLLHRVRTGSAPHGICYFPQPGRYSLGHNGVYR